MRILAVITYGEYKENATSLKALTAGFISDIAWPKVIETAIKAVSNNNFFRHDKIWVEDEDNELDTGKLQAMISDEIYKTEPVPEEEPNPEWLDTMMNSIIAESVNNLNEAGNRAEMIEKLSNIIDATDKTRRMLVEIFLAELEEADEFKMKDMNTSPCPPACRQTRLQRGKDRYEALLYENLFLKGYSNWEIADRLKKHIDTVRLERMKLIGRLSDKNSMYCKTAKGEPFEITRRELQLLRLIAAGYSNEQISEKLKRPIETVKSNRKNLIDKFGVENENTMTMVIKALRMGIIRLEEIDDELPKRIAQAE